MKTLLMLSLLLAGCAEMDPYTRSGVWHPEAVNARNLAAMVANPEDLRRGHGDPGPDSQLATQAAVRLYTGTAKPLPPLNDAAAPAALPGAAPTAAPAAASPTAPSTN